jgi:hypothetical protein
METKVDPELMPLTAGSRLGPYEIVSPLGVGGMSACGHAEPRTCESEVRHRRQFARGRGPQRGSRVGVPAVGPQRQCRKV